MVNKRVIFAIIGKAGSGKDSILNGVLQHISYLSRITPVTTRKKRDNEKDNLDYHFVTDDEFEQSIKDNEFMTWTSYTVKNNVVKNDNKNVYYGYPYPTAPVSIEIYPYKIYKLIYKNPNLIFIPIYITHANQDEIIFRLIQRELNSKDPNLREVSRRISADYKDFPSDEELRDEFKEGVFENAIINGTIDDVVKFIKLKLNEVYGNGMSEESDAGRNNNGTVEG